MRPDREDRQRLSRHLERLLGELRVRRRLTNHEVRRIAGSRGMGRVNDLIRRYGCAIDVRKVDGSTWMVTFLGEGGPDGSQLPLL